MFRVVIRRIFGAVLAIGIVFSAQAQAHASSAEDSMLGELNDARRAYGLTALRDSSLLSESASSYSRYMLARDYFGHLSAVRTSSKFTLKGEVLAWHSGSNPRVGPTVASWLGSPSHRRVILHPRMRYVGAGMARGRLGGGTATVWTIHFGRL